MNNRKIKMGMVGGGLDAFIGAVHRRGASMNGLIELVCGAFSASSDKSKATGEALFLHPTRTYSSYQEMIENEKKLPLGERMDFVAIVTPNHLHFPVAKMALENGFHVVSDKPATFNTSEAKQLKEIIKKTGLIYALTHNYTAYPMVKEAKKRIENGEIGTIRKVIVEYPQGWLSSNLENSGQKQASWRTDPSKSGAGGSIGDIGTHAENLAEYITGLKISELCADVSTFVEGRKLDDDANILLRFSNGAKGILHCSQICNGEENDINIRIYGEKGGLKWRQMEPNTLIQIQQDGTTKQIRTGVGILSEATKKHTFQPAGHPEGYIETFANIYRNFALALQSKWNNTSTDPDLDFMGIEEGIRGMEFIDAVLLSNQNGSAWTKLQT